MATITHPRKNHFSLDLTGTKLSLWAVPLGRIFFSLIFIFSGINHFSSGSIGYAASQGVPMANILVPVSGVIALLGGLSVLTGFHARFGALLLILFLVPVTFSMHAFWSISDPQAAQMEMIHFMKNISMLGGAIILAFYGAGPISVDNQRARKATSNHAKAHHLD